MDRNLFEDGDGNNGRHQRRQPSDSERNDGGDEEYELIPTLLLTPEAAADLLSISQATLWRLVRRDRIRCVEIIAEGFRRPIRRFRLVDLQAFVDKAVR